MKVAELEIVLKAQMGKVKADLLKLKKLLQDTEPPAAEAASGITNVANALKAVFALGALQKLAQFGKQFIDFAGQVDTVSTAFRNLAKTAEGGSDALVESVKEMTGGTVSNLDIMKSSNLAIQLMGKDVMTKLPEMARIARASARASGESVSKMLNDIVVASGRQSVMILDNLGISSARATQEIEKYAKSLGKTRDQLTDAEKKAAFFNAVLVAGGELADDVGVKNKTLGEELQALSATFKNVATSIAGVVAGPLKQAVSDFNQSLKDIEKNIEAWKNLYARFQIWAADQGQAVARAFGGGMTKEQAARMKAGAQSQLAGGPQGSLFDFDIPTAGKKPPPSKGGKRVSNAQKQAAQLLAIERQLSMSAANFNKDKIDKINIQENTLLQKIRENRKGNLLKSVSLEKQVMDQARAQREQAEKETNRKIAQDALSAASQLTSQLGGIASQYMTNKNMAIDASARKEQESLDKTFEIEKKKIINTEKNEKKRNKKLKALDEKKARDDAKLQKKTEKEKRKIAREGAIYQKAAAVTQSIINTSVAATKAYAQAGIFGGPAFAAILIALGAIQTGLILAQPLPELAAGGLFSGPAIIAEKGRELAVPLTGPEGKDALAEVGESVIDVAEERAVGVSGGVSNPVYLDGTLVGEWIYNGSLDGTIIMAGKGIV